MHQTALDAPVGSTVLNEDNRRDPAQGVGGLRSAQPLPFNILMSVGLGMYLAWQAIQMSPSVYPAAHAGTLFYINIAYYPQTALFVALLGGIAFWTYRKGALLRKRMLITTVGAVLTGATLLVLYCGWWSGRIVPVGIVAGTMLYAGKALFIVLWGELYCAGNDMRSILSCMAGAYLTSFGICLLVANAKPSAAYVIFFALPALSSLLLWILNRESSFALRVIDAKKTRPSEIPFRFFIGIGLFAFVVQITNTLSEAKNSDAQEMLTLLAGLLVAFLILLLSRLYRQTFDLPSIYRLVTPFFLISILLVLTIQTGHQTYEAFCIGSSWAFFRIFTWTMWCSLGVAYRIPPACIFAIGQAVLSCFSLCGSLAMSVVPDDTPILIIISAVLLILVFTSTLLLDNKYLVDLLGARRIEKLKPDSNETLAACVSLVAKENNLSAREQEILLLVAQGQDNIAIQEAICIANSTLRTHLRNIYGKTNTHSRRELIKLVFDKSKSI